MPPRCPGWDRRQTTDACVRWAATLVEPLLSSRLRSQLDASLAEAAMADPGLVALCFAGAISDTVGTLPGSDPWRTVVRPAPTEPLEAGERPPEAPESRWSGSQGQQEAPSHPGALQAAPAPSWISGAPFGTWRDGTDLVELGSSPPERDLELVVLTDGLSPHAAQVLLAGFDGWRQAWAEAMLSAEAIGILEVDDLADALRWACWRRRAYGLAPAEDLWPYESIWQWALRGFALLERDETPDEAELAHQIDLHRIVAPGASSA